VAEAETDAAPAEAPRKEPDGGEPAEHPEPDRETAGLPLFGSDERE